MVAHLLSKKDFVACGDKSGRAIGGMFSVALSIALGLSTCCARPLAGILLCGARTFLHAHEAHSGCLADFHSYYIAATLFIFNTLQIIFRLTLICHRAHPKIRGGNGMRLS